MSAPILHATAIALHCGGYWRTALLRGPSGVGKSDLALRALSKGWRVVADDRVLVWVSAGRLFGRAPATLSGLIEARGLDVLPVPSLAFAQIALVADLIAWPDAVERIPEPSIVELEGVPLPRITLFSMGNSAVAKLTFALQAAPLG